MAQGKRADELVARMNEAAEQAVPDWRSNTISSRARPQNSVW
jgi:hypothetical protein